MTDNGATETTDEYPDYDEDYYDESDYEPTPRAFCDNYVAHEPHVYTAVNHSTYSCWGLTAGDLADMEAYEASVGTCEHGMRADMCQGPMHYESYEDERARAGY